MTADHRGDRRDRTPSRRSHRWLVGLLTATGVTGLALVLVGVLGGSALFLGADAEVDVSGGRPSASASDDGAAAGSAGARHDHAATRSLSRPRALPAYRVKPAPAPLKRKPVKDVVPYTVRVGTLNVLGSNHTRNSTQWAPGVVRAAREAAVIEARDIDVIGFQELQTDQIAVLQRDLGSYDLWPGTALGPNGYRLQVAWRSDLFELVDTGTITTVFSHQLRPVPWVRLRSRDTGGELYFVSLHNSPRGLEAERDSATGAEIGLFDDLLSTGLPVVVVGDTNEPYEFFCRVAPATGMAALNGASAAGGCSVPHPSGLDWVMGGARETSFSFSNYHRDAMPGMSDHPIVYGDVALATTIWRDPVSGQIVK